MENVIAEFGVPGKIERGDSGLRKGKKAPVDLSDAGAEACRDYAYRLLGSRPKTEREFADCLIEKKVEAGLVDSLVAEFREIGLLDDRLYAQLYAEGHEDWGRERIVYELRRRGIEKNVLDAVLHNDPEAEKQRAKELADDWLARGLEWRKVSARLLRRGFSPRIVGSLSREGEDSCEW